MTLSVAAAPSLVLFNEKVIRRFKEEHAKVFVLAIDEVAASVRTAGMVRKHFPQVPIYARARNRHHTPLLTELGVRTILRATLYSTSSPKRCWKAWGSRPTKPARF